MANFRSKPVLAPPLEKIWRDGLHGLVSGSSRLSPFVGDYPFGTVLRPRNDSGMRIMAVGDEKAAVLCPPAGGLDLMSGDVGPYKLWDWEPVQGD